MARAVAESHLRSECGGAILAREVATSVREVVEQHRDPGAERHLVTGGPLEPRWASVVTRGASMVTGGASEPRWAPPTLVWRGTLSCMLLLFEQSAGPKSGPIPGRTAVAQRVSRAWLMYRRPQTGPKYSRSTP